MAGARGTRDTDDARFSRVRGCVTNLRREPDAAASPFDFVRVPIPRVGQRGRALVTLGPTTLLEPEVERRSEGAKTVLVGTDAGVLPFDVVESKVHAPALRPETVWRTPLVNRLRAAGAFPLVLVVAPAGYGKTTLLSQWAERDARPFAWISIDERDNDPAVLLRHVGAAFARIEAIDSSTAESLRVPGESVWDTAVPRLTAQLAASASPFVLVLDDADLLETPDSVNTVAALAENIPSGSMIALAGRVMPKLPVAALRAGGPLLEIGSFELALSRREAELLLRAAGVELEEEEMVELLHRTEGWAAGLYLAALASQARGAGNEAPQQPADFDGDDRYLADYFRSEYLSQLSRDRLVFLRRTSVLEKLCGSLCDAVLERKGSALEIEQIEDSNLFVVPLDRKRGWYRYHHLFRDLLRRELEDESPELVRGLNRRAAEWYLAKGDPESALDHAYAAGDIAGAARILSSIALGVHYSGRVETVEGWLDRFDDETLDRYPGVAIHGCRIHALRGRPDEATRWLDAAERGTAGRRSGVAAVRPWISVMRAAMCADGPKQMRADAQSALAKLPPDEAWLPAALLVHGAAALLLGENELADAILVEAAEASERLGSTETRVVATSERSLLAAAREDRQEADLLALEARRLVDEGELSGYATSALALVASARALLRHGQWDQARRQLTSAERLASALTHALPWLAVQVRLELGQAYVTLRNREDALRLLREAGEILALRPLLGVLADRFAALEQEISTMPEPQDGANSSLTAAELRLLPLMSTHLSFREIGEQLYVSRNTIKTQAISVYRKLGVSSRSGAITRAGELGLIEAAAIDLPLRGDLRQAAS